MIAFDGPESTTVEIDNRMSPTDFITPVFKITKAGDLTSYKSVFGVYKQRKVKGRRRKIWEEKSREYL